MIENATENGHSLARTIDNAAVSSSVDAASKATADTNTGFCHLRRKFFGELSSDLGRIPCSVDGKIWLFRQDTAAVKQRRWVRNLAEALRIPCVPESDDPAVHFIQALTGLLYCIRSRIRDQVCQPLPQAG